MSRKIIAGNWKMNLSTNQGIELIQQIEAVDTKHTIIAFPSFVSLSSIAKEAQKISVGAQNCGAFQNGAYTGEVSTQMIKDVKAEYVLVGHSERRVILKENNTDFKAKIQRCLEQNLKVIFCIGENLEQRQAGNEQSIVSEQLSQVLSSFNTSELSNITIAYEPVWAIGTGKNANNDQIESMHRFIKQFCKESFKTQFKVLYGGSCKPTNAQEIFSCKSVDGVLVGGASLKADAFISIIQAAG